MVEIQKKTAYWGLVDATGEDGTITNEDLLNAADKYVNFVPILGTIVDYWKFTKNPNKESGFNLLSDIGSEIFKYKMFKSGAKLLNKSKTVTKVPAKERVKTLSTRKYRPMTLNEYKQSLKTSAYTSYAGGFVTPIFNDAIQGYAGTYLKNK